VKGTKETRVRTTKHEILIEGNRGTEQFEQILEVTGMK